MRLRIFCLAAALVGLSAAGPASAASFNYLADNDIWFGGVDVDPGTYGWFPGGGTTGSSTAQMVNDTYHTVTTTSDQLWWTGSFVPGGDFTTGDYYMEIGLRLTSSTDGANGSQGYYAAIADTNVGVTIGFDEDKLIVNGNTVVFNVTDGNFHHYRVVTDDNGGNPIADLIIDGTTVLSGFAVNGPGSPVNGIAAFGDSNQGASEAELYMFEYGDIADLTAFGGFPSSIGLAVPEPGSLALLTSGLLGLAWFGRGRRGGGQC